MQVLLLLGSVSSLMTLVTGKCPPDKGKYSDRVRNRGRPAPKSSMHASQMHIATNILLVANFFQVST